MSTSKPVFDVSEDDFNFEVGTPPTKPTIVVPEPSKVVEVTTASQSSAPNTQASSTTSLKDKLRLAAQGAASAYVPSSSTQVPVYIPAKTPSPTPSVPASTTSPASTFDIDEYDPNSFDGLTQSGEYYQIDEKSENGDSKSVVTDPDYYAYDEEDDDHSRDLCSNPCIQCGKVPSYVVYELCDECLDKMGPQ